MVVESDPLPIADGVVEGDPMVEEVSLWEARLVADANRAESDEPVQPPRRRRRTGGHDATQDSALRFVRF